MTARKRILNQEAIIEENKKAAICGLSNLSASD
jgi:hypothetical protein